MSGILTIAHLTLHEALRRKIVLVALVLGIGFLIIFGLGFLAVINTTPNSPVPRAPFIAGQQFIAIAFVVMAGLYAVNFLLVMMAALMPVDTISGEIRSGAIQTLATKPLRRSQILLGKWLGFWVILALYFLLMAGGVILIAQVFSGYAPPNVLEGMALMLLKGTLLLTLSIAGGTRLSTLANGVMVFGMYGLAFIGGWVEQIGALHGNDGATNIGIVASLLMPSEALWNLAAYNMQPAVMRDLNITPFSPASVPSASMVAWAVAYLLVVLGFGLRQFETRDL